MTAMKDFYLENGLGRNKVFSILFLEPFLEFHWKLFVTLLTTRLQVDIVKFGFFCQMSFTEGTCKMFRTPGLVQCGDGIAINDLVTNKAHIAKQLVVMSLAVC